MNPETLLRRMMFGCVSLMVAGALSASLYAAYGPRELFIGVPLAVPAPPEPSDVASLIVSASDRYGVPWWASMALAESESGLQPDAVGCDGGCFGIFQLNGKYFVGARTMSAAENVDNGVRYFTAMMMLCDATEGVTLRGYPIGQKVWNTQCAVDRYRGKKR